MHTFILFFTLVLAAPLFCDEAAPLAAEEEATAIIDEQSPAEEIASEEVSAIWKSKAPVRKAPAPALSSTMTPPETSNKNTNPMSSMIAENLRSSFQFGGNYTWAHVHPKGLHSTSGNLGGIQAIYEYKFPKTIYAAGTLAWRQGTTKDGYERTITYFDAEERLGYTFGTCCDRWSYSLFTGLGWRYYGEDVTSHGDTVTFNYNEVYVPLGFLTSVQVNSCFAIGLNGQWMPQVYPTVKITPLKGARWILRREIANFRVELPFTFTLSKNYHYFLVFEPFFEYWQDGRSTAKDELGTSLGIHRNTYYFAGANVNIGFMF